MAKTEHKYTNFIIKWHLNKIMKDSFKQKFPTTYPKVAISIALPTALRKILMGHELDKLENTYMKSVELSIEEARAYINPGFKKFFGVNDIFELKEA